MVLMVTPGAICSFMPIEPVFSSVPGEVELDFGLVEQPTTDAVATASPISSALPMSFIAMTSTKVVSRCAHQRAPRGGLAGSSGGHSLQDPRHNDVRARTTRILCGIGV